jgi:hypothetical protein
LPTAEAIRAKSIKKTTGGAIRHCAPVSFTSQMGSF